MHYTSIRILKPRRQLKTRKIQTRENSGTSKQNSSRASEPSSKLYLRISAVLAISVLLVGSAGNSLYYVYADNSTQKTTTAKGNVTTHTSKSGKMGGHQSAINKVVKDYNHSGRVAQHDETIALKQAQQNLQAVVKQTGESVQQSKVTSSNTISAKGNATALLGTSPASTGSLGKEKDVNKAYRESVAEARAGYIASLKKTNQDARTAIMQLREQLNAAGTNKTDVNAMMSAKATFWKEYFNIVIHRAKANADARETLLTAQADAMLTKFKALGTDTPALDSAVQDYKNAVDHAIQKFKGAVDAANEHVKSEIDTKFSLSTTK